MQAWYVLVQLGWLSLLASEGLLLAAWVRAANANRGVLMPYWRGPDHWPRFNTLLIGGAAVLLVLSLSLLDPEFGPWVAALPPIMFLTGWGVSWSHNRAVMSEHDSGAGTAAE